MIRRVRSPAFVILANAVVIADFEKLCCPCGKIERVSKSAFVSIIGVT